MMNQQLTRRLVGYFSLALLLFALMIGSCFAFLFTGYSRHVHEEELQRRVETLAASIPSMGEARSLLAREAASAAGNDDEAMVKTEGPMRMHGHGMMADGHHAMGAAGNPMMAGHEWCRQSYGSSSTGSDTTGNPPAAGALAQLNQLAEGQVWLVSAADRTIYSYGETAETEVGDLPQPVDTVLQQVLSGGTTVSQDFTPLIGTAAVTAGAPIRDENNRVIGAVLIHQPLKDMQAAQWGGLRLLGLSLLLALLISGGLAVLLARRFIRPIYRMQAAARSFTQGNFNHRTEVRQQDELGMLARDIDHLGAQLGQAQAERESMQQRRQDFLSAVSHELRTPLTVLRGTLELLLSGLVKDPDKRKDYANQAMDNLTALERLVGDLLEFTRLRNPAFSIEKIPMDLAEAFREAVRSVEPLAEQKGIRLLADLTHPIPLSGDYGRLRQLMLILLDNALKFSPSGGTIIVKEMTTAAGWCIVVIDQGNGIAPEVLPYIFERFRTSRTQENAQGTGLGLPIAKEIAERHGLSICCESELGTGTRFILQHQSTNRKVDI